MKVPQFLMHKIKIWIEKVRSVPREHESVSEEHFPVKDDCENSEQGGNSWPPAKIPKNLIPHSQIYSCDTAALNFHSVVTVRCQSRLNSPGSRCRSFGSKSTARQDRIWVFRQENADRFRLAPALAAAWISIMARFFNWMQTGARLDCARCGH